MAYQDPYAEQPGRSQSQRRYGESTADYNPYSTSQPHQTYDHGGIGPSYDTYRDEPQYDPPHKPRYPFTGAPLNVENDVGGIERPKETSQEAAMFSATGERTPKALRNYRYIHQGALWTKGGRGRCVGRFCCCTLMTAVLLFVCIVLALALWVRPPNIEIGAVNTIAKDGSAIQLVENGISINLGVNISVNNPNYFAVNFQQVKAEISYLIGNETTEIGEGIAKNVVFHSHTLTNWTFPFTIDYKTTLDPQHTILVDLAKKCGVTGSKSDLSVNYKISLALRILFIPISPVIHNMLNFACPIDPATLESLIKNSGINIGGLLGT